MIAGEGPLQGDLQSLARELDIASSIRFVGFLSQAELREQLFKAHIFLHPSELGVDEPGGHP